MKDTGGERLERPGEMIKERPDESRAVNFGTCQLEEAPPAAPKGGE